MKQKMFLTAAAALVLLFLSASLTRAAEITIDWRQKLDSGMVDDLHFMPGQEQFILSSGQVQKFTEIRSCEDGSIIRTYPFGGYQFEFTPDSTKLIFMSGPSVERGEMQLRNLSDMSVISQYQLPKDEELPYSYFVQMAVDPVRPFIYAIWLRRGNNPQDFKIKTKILIYDRATLLQVGELTSNSDSSLYFTEIAVSKDGKYLAAMNAWKSKLIVWSLDTRQKVVDNYISDQNSDKSSSSADIKFSELNTDKIYFTGEFYKENNDVLAGLCVFSVSENRIIDSTFAIPTNGFGWNPEITLFDNETKVMGTSDGYLRILDLINKKIEFTREVTPKNELAVGSINYSEKLKFFIGGSYLVDKFRYHPNTNVPGDNPKEVIYPNPTTGFVNISLNCIFSSKYEIYNTSGRLLNSSILKMTSNGLLTIDFTQYPTGVYSIKVYCGNEVQHYQVVRGE